MAASDAFFPFPDGLEVLLEAGVRAVVQPGGSMRDNLVVEAAAAAGVPMYSRDAPLRALRGPWLDRQDGRAPPVIATGVAPVVTQPCGARGDHGSAVTVTVASG